MNNPLVSVIMNCYNSDKFLFDAIKSIINQTYVNWELIFWDNQSSDNSSAILKSFNDQRIKYFYSESHTKLGLARNKAIARAKGSLIAFLDCDDVWYPEKLQKQVPLFINDNIGIVICDTIFFNEKKIIRQLYKYSKPPKKGIFKKSLTNYFISLETVVVRKKALDSLKSHFNPNYQVIEEFDVITRILYKWDLGYVDEVLSKWRVDENSGTWKYPELFPLETEDFIKNMSEHIEDFHLNFQTEIKWLKYKIAIQKSIVCWRNGDVGSVRTLIKPYFLKNNHATILYFWTFFPFKTFDIFYKYRRGL